MKIIQKSEKPKMKKTAKKKQENNQTEIDFKNEMLNKELYQSDESSSLDLNLDNT